MKNLLFLAFSFCFSNFNSNAVLENQFKIDGSVSSDFVNPDNPTYPFKIEKLVAIISAYLGKDKFEFSGVNSFMLNVVKLDFPEFKRFAQKSGFNPVFKVSPSIRISRFDYSESSIFGVQSDFLKRVGPEGSVSFFMNSSNDEFSIPSEVENLIVFSLNSMKGSVKNILFADSGYSYYRNYYTFYFKKIVELIAYDELVCDFCDFVHLAENGFSESRIPINFDNLFFDEEVGFNTPRYIETIKEFNQFFSKVKCLNPGYLKCRGIPRGVFDGGNNPDITHLDLNLFSKIIEIKNGFVSNLPGLKEVDMSVMSELREVEGVLFENCPNLEVIFMTQFQFENFSSNVWEPKRDSIKLLAQDL